MEKIIMLGTGNAMVTKCYNTCFLMSKNKEYLLIDGGGGNNILRQLKKVKVDINQIHNIFVSHNHSDHIMGIIWVIRLAAQSILKGTYNGTLNIYCHNHVIKGIRSIAEVVLQPKFLKLFDEKIIFNSVNHDETINILDTPITFFDIQSTKELQYGFVAQINPEKKFVFLGDEPYNEKLERYCKDVDYLFHEAFCLYRDKELYNPYEKHHATVIDACENAKKLNAKAVILSHTEDTNIKKRKKLYIEEGRSVYQGHIYVPDDLDTIELI